jgi:ubiquinone/menaquinone biosynthesis C-methylase UbiE
MIMRTFLRLVPLAMAATVSLPAAASAQNGSLDPQRIFAALALRDGATVCEMGAGNGELTLAAAKIVGERGRVYTSELGDRQIKALEKAVADRPQIQVVAAAAERTNFPDGACDALFMRNVYHHFAAPEPITRSMLASMRPGGRLAVVDFTPPGDEAPTAADRDQDNMHGVKPETVSRELKAAGFDVVGSESGSGRWFMVVAARPAS